MQVPSNQSLTPAFLSAQSRLLYQDGSRIMRMLQWYRPFICPFEALMEFVPPRSSVLDVGCGGGLFLALLHATAKLDRGFGFDSSRPAIHVAQRMAQRARLRNPQCQLDFQHLDVADPWPDGVFDVVSLIDVMHHVPATARENLLEMLVARIRPGGRLIYKDMCRRPLWRAWANRLHDLVLARQWIEYVPVAWVDQQITAHGLRLLYQETINCLWYGHELRVYEKMH